MHFLVAIAIAKAQTKEEALSTIKSLIINYADNELPVKAVYFGTQKGELAILYENKNLVINELAQLNAQDLSWSLDNDGSGSLQISSSGSGSILYDYCTTAGYQGKVGDFFSFDNIGLIGFNKTEREYSKFLFNKAFFKDPFLKTKFEKAVKRLIVLCNGNGSQNDHSPEKTQANLPGIGETFQWLKSKMILYASDNLSISNMGINGDSILLIYYGDGTLSGIYLYNLKCSGFAWKLNDDGSGTLEIAANSFGSYRTGLLHVFRIDHDDFHIIVNTGSGQYAETWYTNIYHRWAYASIFFNKAFFQDPTLKQRFEKAMKHLIVLYGGDGSEREAF